MKEAVVVFNSLKEAVGANNNNLTYKFDWSILEDCPYKISFCYHGLSNKNNGSKLPLIYIDLGAVSQTYITGISNYSNQTQFLGKLHAGEKVSGDAPYITSYEMNEPIIIKSRPRNQNPRIYVENIDGTPFIDSNGGELADYVLSLRLEKVKYED